MKKIFLMASAVALLFAACNKSENKATLSVRLTDAPADYEEVLIDVKEVMINVSTEGDENGWQTMEGMNAGVYNLLDFTNGMDTLLAEQELAAGKVSQMRLVLGDDNQVKKNGEYYELKTPSSQQSGLKFNIHADLVEGVTYKLWIDFDAGRSIVEKGNGTFSLKPVIRTFTEATSGAIKGEVSPVEAKPYVMAISANNDTLATYADTASGKFLIKGVEPGTYTVNLLPIEGYVAAIDTVEVVLGAAADLGLVEFSVE